MKMFRNKEFFGLLGEVISYVFSPMMLMSLLFIVTVICAVWFLICGIF